MAPILMLQAQWFIAVGSIGSTLLALALALGMKDWLLRPRVDFLLRYRSHPEQPGDCVVTKRSDTGEVAAFVRLRLDNRGRSTARRVAVRLLRVERWDQDRARWVRSRPELDGRALQPSNQRPDEPDTVDVFPYSDRILDLVSVSYAATDHDPIPILVEIGRPWPPNGANVLEPGTWKLELLVCGDNFNAQRYFVTVFFDGTWPAEKDPEIFDHIHIEGPSTRQIEHPSKLIANVHVIPRDEVPTPADITARYIGDDIS